MSAKILSSTIIDMNAFCQDPIRALHHAEAGTLAVLANNKPQLYAITPDRLAQLLALEAAAENYSDVALDNSLFVNMTTPIAPPVGKFALYEGWQPDADFLRQAAIWGVVLLQPVTSAELASFVAYWRAEGKMFHHVQWQQKLARSLQTGRAAASSQQKRDINAQSAPDNTIPDGFRGE